MSDDILARLKAAAPRVEPVDTSLGRFYMQSISGERQWQLLQIQTELVALGRNSIPPALIIAVALCDESGNALNAGEDGLSETMQVISRMNREQMNELYLHALRVTGFGRLSVEEGEKKSSSSQSSEAGTNSPS